MFEDTINKLEEALKDIKTLTVRTYTGSLSGVIGDNAAPPKLSLDEILTNAKAKGNIELVAQTEIEIGGDLDQFLTSDNVSDDIKKAHFEAVTAGQESREALYSIVVGAVKSII